MLMFNAGQKTYGRMDLELTYTPVPPQTLNTIYILGYIPTASQDASKTKIIDPILL